METSSPSSTAPAGDERTTTPSYSSPPRSSAVAVRISAFARSARAPSRGHVSDEFCARAEPLIELQWTKVTSPGETIGSQVGAPIEAMNTMYL
jgi:hypothetical protein